jgi:hypothetical protein
MAILRKLLILLLLASASQAVQVKPPRGLVFVNGSHPLSRGPVVHWLMNEGMGSVAQDLSGSRNHIDTFSGGAAWGVGLGGPGLMCGYNNADYTSAPDHPLHTGNPGTTLLVWATNNKDTVTSSGSEFLISKLNSFNLFWSQGEQVGGSVRIGSSTKSFGTPISTQVNGTRLSLYGFVHNNLTATPIFNGVVYTANAVAAVGAVDNTANALLFGGDGGNSSWDGTIYAVALYAVALSIPEIASLSRDPYAMLQQDPITMYATTGGEPPAASPVPVFQYYYNQMRAGFTPVAIPIFVVLSMAFLMRRSNTCDE